MTNNHNKIHFLFKESVRQISEPLSSIAHIPEVLIKLFSLFGELPYKLKRFSNSKSYRSEENRRFLLNAIVSLLGDKGYSLAKSYVEINR